MIRLMPEFGGKRLLEDDERGETKEGNENDKWGMKICRELEQLMGESSTADFCDDKGIFLYSVAKVGNGIFTIYNLKTFEAYGVSDKGHIVPGISVPEQGMILKETIEQDIALLKTLTQKKTDV